MALRPPQHRIDATPTLVSIQDPAWDWDRVERETEDQLDGDGQSHPVREYHRGSTRYDLDAPSKLAGATVTAKDYLGDDYTGFRLRRLTVDEHATARDLVSAVGINKATEFACRWGLVDAKGYDMTRRGDGSLSDPAMSQVRDAGGLDLIVEIGAAVMRISEGLTAAEKKASAF